MGRDSVQTVSAKRALPGAGGLVARQPSSPADLLSDIDTQLMLQVRQGDREAAGTLIRRNYDLVARYIGRILRRPRLVEDVTQEVFTKILAHAHTYEATAKFKTYMYRVATNTALKSIADPDEAVVHDEVIKHKADDNGAPHARMDLDELQARVRNAINQLPPNQKAATILFDYEGLSYVQIAAVLNVTEDAVRALLARARGTLRGSLGELAESQ